MGRKLKRALAKQERRENKKNMISMTYQDLIDMKQKTAQEQNDFTVENLFMLFALAEHRVHKFGSTRIFRTLKYIEELMDPIISGEKDFSDYAAELEKETDIKIK